MWIQIGRYNSCWSNLFMSFHIRPEAIETGRNQKFFTTLLCCFPKFTFISRPDQKKHLLNKYIFETSYHFRNKLYFYLENRGLTFRLKFNFCYHFLPFSFAFFSLSYLNVRTRTINHSTCVGDCGPTDQPTSFGFVSGFFYFNLISTLSSFSWLE